MKPRRDTGSVEFMTSKQLEMLTELPRWKRAAEGRHVGCNEVQMKVSRLLDDETAETSLSGEDALAETMTHALEMNCNEIDPDPLSTSESFSSALGEHTVGWAAGLLDENWTLGAWTRLVGCRASRQDLDARCLDTVFGCRASRQGVGARCLDKTGTPRSWTRPLVVRGTALYRAQPFCWAAVGQFVRHDRASLCTCTGLLRVQTVTWLGQLC
jgi:hypothetical protein